MAATSSDSSVSTTRLILVPALITLGVTVLRLVGELQHWSPRFFNPSAGGGGAIVGVSWLPFIFGPYFALKLAGSGQGPKGAGKAITFAVLGLVIGFGGAVVGFAPKPAFPGKLLVGLLLIVAAAALQFKPWAALAKTLVAYGYTARIPVAIVMFFALRGSWGTHYDALPPDYTGPMSFWGKYFAIGVVPQLVFWIATTVIVGALFGSTVIAIARRRTQAVQPAA